MPVAPPEDGSSTTTPVNSTEFSQPDRGMQPPEHISMENLGYPAHLINNTMTVIKLSMDYPDDPSAQQDLREGGQNLVERINFLLKQYEEDLKDMPDFRDFLELLLDMVQSGNFGNVLKLYQLGLLAFGGMKPLAKPGRHLSLENPAILFVDDEEPLRSMFIEMMPESLTDQIDFRIAADGTEALAIIGNTRGRLIAVLTDLGLGEGPNGNAVAKAALDVGVRHVAICTGSTGCGKEELIPGEIRNRILLIAKPYGISDLMAFIEEAMQSSA